MVTHTPGHSEHATPASTPQHPPATRPAAAGSHAPVTSSTSRQPPASASQYPVSGYVVSTCLGGGWLTGDLQPAGPAPQAGCNVMAASPLVHGAAAAGSPASVSKGPRAPSHGSPCAGGAVASPGAPQAEAASNDSAAAKVCMVCSQIAGLLVHCTGVVPDGASSAWRCCQKTCLSL